MKQHLVHFRSN